MKKIWILTISLLAIFFLKTGVAQQITEFRHLEFSHYYYNPAFACDPDKPEIILNHRSQWTGFKGAPQTSSLAGSFMFRDDMSMGLVLSNDIAGPIRKTSLNLNYAYQLKINYNWKIAFGLSWSFMQSGLNGELIDLHDNTDEIVFENLSDKVWKPDANTGILIFSNEYYLGISVMQLLQSRYRFYNSKKGGIQSVRHYYLQAGAKLKTGRRTSSLFHPYINMELIPHTPFSIDIGGTWEYQESIIAGLAYSHSNAIAIIAGYKYNNLSFLYSYDIVTNRLMSVSKGGHEITLSYKLANMGKTQSKPMF